MGRSSWARETEPAEANNQVVPTSLLQVFKLNERTLSELYVLPRKMMEEAFDKQLLLVPWINLLSHRTEQGTRGDFREYQRFNKFDTTGA